MEAKQKFNYEMKIIKIKRQFCTTATTTRATIKTSSNIYSLPKTKKYREWERDRDREGEVSKYEDRQAYIHTMKEWKLMAEIKNFSSHFVIKSEDENKNGNGNGKIWFEENNYR